MVRLQFALNAKANLDAQEITSGFGFLDNTAGFGVNQSLIPYSESDTYGRVFFVGLSQHAAGRRSRHRACDHPRLRHRHRAAVAQLAGGAAGRRLRRADPQLCRSCSRSCSGISPCSARLPGPRQSISLLAKNLSQQSRDHRASPGRRGRAPDASLLPLAFGVLAAVVARACGQSAGRIRTGHEFPALVEQLGADRRPAAHCCPGCRVSRSALRSPSLRGFNFVGGIRLHPGIRGAPARAHDLHRRLHRRGRARRHRCGPARPDRGGARARPAARADAAARRRAAGAARDRAAAHQPVSQPHQELLARGRRSAIPTCSRCSPARRSIRPARRSRSSPSPWRSIFASRCSPAR